MTPQTLTSSLPRSLRRTSKSARRRLRGDDIDQFMDEVFGEDLHAKRVESLSHAVQGVLQAATLAIHTIGQALATVRPISPKSAVKQVDRLLGNAGVNLELVLRQWVLFVVGNATSVRIALDWTDFEPDDQTTLCAYMATGHGRAVPLAWRTIKKSSLKGRQTDFEFEFVDDLARWMPEAVEVILLADRGFGNQRLYRFLEDLGWKYVIRFRQRILVEDETGEQRSAADWVPPNGRAKMLRNVRVTGRRVRVPAVVVVKRRKMQEAWCLATNMVDLKAPEIVKLYGRRFTIEETFRDTKDQRFGMGLSATHIGSPDRRDRLLLLAAIAHSLLTLLGAASEASGLDRYLKVNTVKRRTHSLYRQGLYWYGALPNMREDWCEQLLTEFDRLIREHEFFSILFAVK